jgi:non-ribosomal peptide synthase protein (TIGR01720 family)
MIPAQILHIEKIPLTPNNKVDHRALPTPGTKQDIETHTPPGTDIEEKLQEVWSGVLGIERSLIGIDDNFFEMGLDSIKAIQVSAIMMEKGLKLELRDIFSHPTIRRLAACTTPTLRTAEQETVTGDVPLTPIQQWFFENYSHYPHHFNMAVMLYQKNGFSQKILEKVFSKLLEHHDALRMVFALNRREHEGQEKLPVIQENKGIEEKLFHLEIFDFTKTPEDQYKNIAESILTEAGKIQASIDLQTGPLVKLGLFKTSRGDHLLIVIHHLVIDGISWRILLEDFALGYQQAEQGKPVVLPGKTDSFRYWSQQLTQYAQSKKARAEAKYWESIEQTPLEPLPGNPNVPAEKKKFKYNETLRMELEPGNTGALLKEVNQAYNTEINDILLTALGLAVKEWAGIGNIAVTLEGHGRENIMDNIDISRTVGWFTSQFPVVLDMKQNRDLSTTIKRVKETLRKIPGKGIGYGILKYITPRDKNQGLNYKPAINFNYFGQFGSETKSSIFEISGISTGDAVHPESTNPFALGFNGMITQSIFILSVTYNRYEFEKKRIQELLDLYKSYLIEIILHCRSKETGELTPSDLVDDEDLSIEELEAIKEFANLNIQE